jgi:hypothetical protein
LPASIVLLVAWGGLGLSACGRTNPPTGELRFIDNSRNVVQVIEVVGARTVSSDALGQVPGLPLLGDITAAAVNSVDFIGQNESLAPINTAGLQGQQIEAHLFVDDLTDMVGYLRGVGAALAIQNWDARTTLGSEGLDIEIPFPPNPDWNTATRYEVDALLPLLFWPGTAPLDPADFPNPPGNGSFKSVRFYRPGICGTEISFTNSSAQGVNNAQIFDTISDQLFQKFSSNSSLDGGSAVRAWSRVTTLLDDGLNISGPKGGFFLYFWFTATASGGAQDVNFAANYEYDFTLSDGRVAVTPVRNDLLVQPLSASRDFANALEADLPQTLNQTFIQAQKKGFQPCGGDNGADPSASIALIGGLASAGGQKLGLNADDQTRLQNAISQSQNWSCDPTPDGSTLANFILRAKRINIYPDTLELVRFDDQNPDDPMFALFAAGVTTGDTTSLCSRPRTILDLTQMRYVTRSITTVSR